MPRIVLPDSLRRYWPGAPGEVHVPGATLAEALAHLDQGGPGLALRILDEQGRPRPHVHLFVNHRALGPLAPADVTLGEGDVVHVLPAVSGGARP